MKLNGFNIHSHTCAIVMHMIRKKRRKKAKILQCIVTFTYEHNPFTNACVACRDTNDNYTLEIVVVLLQLQHMLKCVRSFFNKARQVSIFVLILICCVADLSLIKNK